MHPHGFDFLFHAALLCSPFVFVSCVALTRNRNLYLLWNWIWVSQESEGRPRGEDGCSLVTVKEAVSTTAVDMIAGCHRFEGGWVEKESGDGFMEQDISSPHLCSNTSTQKTKGRKTQGLSHRWKWWSLLSAAQLLRRLVGVKHAHLQHWRVLVTQHLFSFLLTPFWYQGERLHPCYHGYQMI